MWGGPPSCLRGKDDGFPQLDAFGQHGVLRILPFFRQAHASYSVADLSFPWVRHRPWSPNTDPLFGHTAYVGPLGLNRMNIFVRRVPTLTAEHVQIPDVRRGSSRNAQHEVFLRCVNSRRHESESMHDLRRPVLSARVDLCMDV